MQKSISFNKLMEGLLKAINKFPDKRNGKNKTYTIEDATLGAFSVFFTQSPSFLEHQNTMKKIKGKSNAETLFQMDKIPTDNHIRDLLDNVPYELVLPVYDEILDKLKATGNIEFFRAFNRDLLISFDGTQHFASKKIHCDKCSTKKLKDGTILYYHSVVTPVISSPDLDKVIPIKPEFIIPQDGYDKQDCENAAFKRWMKKYGSQYSPMRCTTLGDDLYSRQPTCEEALRQGFNFIFVCKEDSHKTLYDWVNALEEGVDRHTVTIKRWNGRFREIYTYRYANKVPLRDSEDALIVNWFDVSITKEKGDIIYQNAFITNHKVSKKNVEALGRCGRSRWKVENENNNTLKTKGYHLEHNYGHGKENLSSLLATLIILAFLFHTVLEIMDAKYRLIRKHLSRRETFFDDIRALTRYICFDNWEHLMNFMMKGLELELEPL